MGAKKKILGAVTGAGQVAADVAKKLKAAEAAARADKAKVTAKKLAGMYAKDKAKVTAKKLAAMYAEDRAKGGLNRMRADVSRIRKKISPTEKVSQLKRINKAIEMKERQQASAEKDVGAITKEGQRRFGPKSGEEIFRKGGLVKKKAAAKKKKSKSTKWLFGFKK
jgi:hypothetical protein